MTMENGLSGQVEIGLASLRDVEALAGLLHLLFTQEVEFRPDRSLQLTGLGRIIENPDIGEILVLRRDGHIVGMASLLYTISTALGGRVALLEDMVVHPQHRANGQGTQLLEAAIRHAREAGCKRITLLTDEANRGAQKFYQRAGFSISSMLPMRMPL